MKKALSVITAVFLVFALVLTASATGAFPSVSDEAQTLTAEQRDSLTEKLDKLSEKYSASVVYATTNEMYSYDVRDSADIYFDNNGYGVGEERDGIIFYICMDTREFYFSTSGECISVFSDGDLYNLEETVLPYLKDGDYAGAVEAYGDACEYVFLKAKEPNSSWEAPNSLWNESYGTSEDVYAATERTLEQKAGFYVFGVILALIIAVVATKKKESQMKTAVKNNSADCYVKPDSVNIAVSQDVFLFSNVSKVARPKETSSSSGSSSGRSSSTHTASSGRTHGGSGGRSF